MVEVTDRKTSTPATQRQGTKTKGKKIRFVNLVSPGRLDYEFLKEALLGIRPFQYHLKRPVSQEPRLISEHAMGVNLAVPKDRESCLIILDHLKNLGVKSVRIDYSYRQDLTRLEELIDGLADLKLRVLLHFIQPLEEGERMPDKEALAEWQLFIETGLTRFNDRIEAIEIGSTINRAKWTRYTLTGFLAAWKVGHDAARKHGLTLVGPNVTDFEPQYNAGVLGMLKKRNLLPDIHSNNLFAERAIEPEWLDQKILGPELKKLHGYELRKKIRLLGAIATRSNISQNWSTSAFWTLPRISRLLDFPEEQQADYLTRYFALCFSQPDFQKIYWGPLISCREGLIDDGTQVVPSSSERDIVSFYSGFPGTPKTWKLRPAFHAFRAFNEFVGGAVYHGALCQRQGLEIHELSKGDERFHIAWTVNGKLARISDCYEAGDLEKLSSMRSRDGETLEERPDFLSQQPLYLSWPKHVQPSLREGAGIIPNVTAAPLASGCRYYDFKTPEWRGIICAKSKQDAAVLGEALGPDRIADQDQKGSLRKSRNAIWTVQDPRDPEGLVVVKKPQRMSFHKRVLDRKKPSKALRSWNGTSQLTRRGIPSPKVIAYFESADPKDLLSNWFICEHVTSGLSVRTFFSKYAAGETSVEGFTFAQFTEKLVAFTLKLHNRGCFFRDLSGGNVLVSHGKKQELEFSLIDTARLRCRSSKIPLRQRLADLKRLVLKLTPSQQTTFMESYLKSLKLRFTPFQKLSFKLYSAKIALKRQKKKLRTAFTEFTTSPDQSRRTGESR